MQRNQIFLDKKKSLKRNKKFLELIYENEELEDSHGWFDSRSDFMMRREVDDEMTLDRFLNIMTRDFQIRLQVGSPTKERIRYCAHGYADWASRFAWVDCPLNPRNYDIVSKLFKESYGKDIEEEKVPKELRKYHLILDRQR